VIKPALSGTEWSNTPFVVLDHDGYWVADQDTPCS
jgi:hypothetical protein